MNEEDEPSHPSLPPEARLYEVTVTVTHTAYVLATSRDAAEAMAVEIENDDNGERETEVEKIPRFFLEHVREEASKKYLPPDSCARDLIYVEPDLEDNPSLTRFKRDVPLYEAARLLMERDERAAARAAAEAAQCKLFEP